MIVLGFPRWHSGKRIHLPMQEMQEMWVQPLGWVDPLDKKMATYYSILAWKIPCTEEPSWLQSMVLQSVRHDWATSLHFTALYQWLEIIGWFPRWQTDKEYDYQCRRCKRCGFDPWARKIPWSRKWQPTPVLLPGKSHRQRTLAGYSLWDGKESDMTEHALIPTQ